MKRGTAVLLGMPPGGRNAISRPVLGEVRRFNRGIRRSFEAGLTGTRKAAVMTSSIHNGSTGFGPNGIMSDSSSAC